MTNVAQKAGSLKEDVAQKPGSLKEEVAQKAGSLKEDVAKNCVAAISAIAVVGLIVAGGSYMLWKRHASSVGTAQEQSQQQGPIAAVESLINRLRGRDMPEGIFKTNGRNEATEVDVSAKYPGRLATETVDEGDEVTAGQVVATISSPETEAQLRNAQAQLLKAKEDVAAAVATVAQRKSDVDFTSADYGRGEKLIKAGWMTQQTLDLRRNKFELAEADYDAAEMTREAAEELVKAAEADVERLQAVLADLVLLSPRTGRVQYRLARAGEVVAAGQRILTILDLKDVYMTIYLPADQAGKLGIGDEARVILDPIPEYRISRNGQLRRDRSPIHAKERRDGRGARKLMFRVKLQADPEVLDKYHRQVKTGVRGLGFVRTDPEVPWPDDLQVKLPPHDHHRCRQIESVTQRYGKTVSAQRPHARYSCAVHGGADRAGRSRQIDLARSHLRGARDSNGKVMVLDGSMADENHRRASYGRIAYMPQGLGRNLYPTLSVFENIDFFGRLFGQGAAERRERIDELLKATGLDPFADRPCGKLSGGMKQKVSLCCSLMHDPDLLVLDEPTTGVDPLSRRQFWELIDSIRARRPLMSVIVATAYMDEASRFDWLAAMDDGKVIAQGAPKQILAQAQKPTLDEAFIALLPPEKRAQHQEVIVRPRPASKDETPAIEAEGLTRRFGDFVAVDHVSFRIGRGEIFGFLGSNGCGKSTTMKMLTGLLPATEGSAKLFGKPMGADDMEARQERWLHVAGVFAVRRAYGPAEPRAACAPLPSCRRTRSNARINELLERYDLKDVADAMPESLPLGIKQRLQLAVAVLHRPPILILDEPTSGVDPVARDAFWRTLIDLSRNDGVTIFLSTHFMNEAERCDRISLMHRGQGARRRRAQG